MKHLTRILTVTFDALGGSDIKDCIEEAIKFSRQNISPLYDAVGPTVSFEFMGKTVTARSNSDPVEVLVAWQRSRINVVVEPAPELEPVGTSQELHGVSAATIAEMNRRMYDS